MLGGPSEPLDVGRQRRFHTKAMRTAMGLRDQGCTAEGCERPPAWCQAHHDFPWGSGGDTNLATGRLLCPRHHTLAHHRYQATNTPNGKIVFTRRT